METSFIPRHDRLAKQGKLGENSCNRLDKYYMEDVDNWYWDYASNFKSVAVDANIKHEIVCCYVNEDDKCQGPASLPFYDENGGL